MKIIDLLNKIANGEEVPKKIKYRDWLYEFEKDCNDYMCQYDSLLYRENDDVRQFLNDEVEIIEEDKNHDLQQRIYKAIEYIKEWQSFPHTNCTTHKELKNLLNILKGDMDG